MDINDLNNLLSVEQVIENHIQWLFVMLPVIWASLAGACLRILLLLHEPLLLRIQNAFAGMLLAVVLSDTTAQILSSGNYMIGYAVLYGIVGRELVITLYDFFNDTARPFLLALMIYLFPFLKPVVAEEDNHDDIKHH